MVALLLRSPKQIPFFWALGQSNKDAYSTKHNLPLYLKSKQIIHSYWLASSISFLSANSLYKSSRVNTTPEFLQECVVQQEIHKETVARQTIKHKI